MPTNQKKYLDCVIVFLTLVFICVPLYAKEKNEDIEVITEGLAANKEEALLNAKRAAVEKGIGVVIITETEVKNFMVEKDKILTNTMGAVKKYKVIKEEETPDGLHAVKIKAVVSLASISKDLAALQILLETMDKPRVMILVDETIEDKRTKNCETSIADKLLEYKFDLVDPAMAAALLDKGDELIEKACLGDKTAAIKIGKANGAEVIIVGNVKTSEGSPMFGMKSGQADIAVQAIMCSNGKLMASKNIHGAFMHTSLKTAMSNAVKKASRNVVATQQKGKVVTSFFDQIIGAWQDMANNGIPVKLMVKNVSTFKAFKAVKKLVAEIDSNVVSVTQRGWSKPKLELDVQYKGTAEGLCEKIDGKVISGIGTLNIENFTAGSIQAVLK